MKKQVFEITLRWGDMDLLGHVNNLAIVGYFQEARIRFTEMLGIPPLPGMHSGPIEAATNIQFSRQLHYPGNITLSSYVEKIGNTSFTLHHTIIDSEGKVAVSGTEVIVYFDFVNQCKIPLTEALREKLQKFLPDAGTKE